MKEIGPRGGVTRAPLDQPMPDYGNIEKTLLSSHLHGC